MPRNSFLFDYFQNAPGGGFFCIDFDKYDFEIKDTDYGSLNTKALYFVIEPCQMEEHDGTDDISFLTFESNRTADNIREDCVADESKQKEYLGDTIGVAFLFNTESF